MARDGDDEGATRMGDKRTAELASAIELARRIHSLYGEVDWPRQTGILHVAAIQDRPPVVIALGPAAPASPVDRFVLGLARARADAIVTSGSILRAEPDLLHRYAENDEEQAAFARWRRDVLGRRDSPSLIVLSGSGAFPTDHPALAAAGAGFVWTSPEGRDRIGAGLPESLAVEIPDRPAHSLAQSVSQALEHAQAKQGARTILIEAGPTIATTLYPEQPERGAGRAAGDVALVDELLLSRFEGLLEDDAIGPPFIAEERIGARLGAARTTVAIREDSGPWRFERYRVKT